ncbi:MAG: ornithine cyclodeaminase [Rhizobiales bacterium 65-9]|nr:ornithine cyclodeaminase family protein [Hyphomicrobiales bacterium]OJY35049.1 MAG: ornithine cyclodeaminase [Rhizobiales bacterium 65-9]
MKIIDAAAVDAALTPQAMTDAIGAAFASDLVAPERHHHHIARDGADAAALLMPAWTASGGKPAYLGVKIVSVFPGNATRGLPSVQGSYILNDGETGAPLAVIDGARLTLHRTAAASAYAARHLARHDARLMVMVGSGALSTFLIRAHCAARPSIRHVYIWNRNVHRAVETAAALDRDPLLANVAVDAGDALETAVREADLISCATMASAPLVRGAWLKEGAHLDLVGGYSMATREADDEALARASVFIDTPACLKEGGDVAIAVRSGAFSADRVRGDLRALATGAHKGRASDREITLFKSIGASVEDLAAAMLVWKSAGAGSPP